mgnify:CR=1 FL=1
MIKDIMFRGFSLIFVALCSVAVAPAAEPPGEFYFNRDIVQNPQVNALHFVNEGELFSTTSLPWTPQNTLTFTNRGLMRGTPGLHFEHIDAQFGFRNPSQVFFNSSEGQILGSEVGAGIVIPGGGVVSPAVIGSIIKVNALNITNRGILSVGANGLIELFGDNIDLTAGGLIVGDLFDPLTGGGGSGFPISSNTFSPSAGIYDLGFGIGGNTNASAQGVIATVNPTDIGTLTPPPIVTNFGSFPFPFRLDNAQTWVREEVINESNEVVQVIAVQVADTNIVPLASFIPQTFLPAPLEGDFLTAAVELQVPSTDLRTLTRVTNSVYVLDQLGAHTNRDIMVNIRDGTGRPGNFIVHRGPIGQYGGEPGTTNLRADIFTAHVAITGTNTNTVDYVSTIVTNEWSIYPFEVSSMATRLPQIPGVALTNLGGRVEVTTDQLRFVNTRIRGEGLVSITASNVITMPGFSNIVDVPNLNIDFGTPGEVLRVDEFFPDLVERLSGQVVAYSSIFTNSYENFTTNLPADPADTNITIVTNSIEVRFQLTLVDARGLITQEETRVGNLQLTSVNGRGAIIFNEDLDVTNYVQLRANEITFTENSRLAGGFGVQFSYTNLLNVSVITNLGSIEMVELIDLRKSHTQRLDRFVNHGSMFGYGVEIWADYFENAGSIFASRNITLRTSTLRIDSGAFFAGGDIQLSGDVIKISNLQAQAGGRLVLDGQTITDIGGDGPNDILVTGGFEMLPRRPSGDLLGTVITSTNETFQFVNHIWDSEDRGPTAAGFANNVALGALVLQGGTNSAFQFLPAQQNSSMYVEVLAVEGVQATSLAALTNGIILGMNVYYANVISTNEAITAQSLNRVFGPDAPFNLIWVPDFAGANSSVDVPMSATGPVTRMNRGLRESLTVDSDGDGVPNGLDEFPLSATAGGAVDVQLIDVRRNGPAGTISFGMVGPQAANYVIEWTLDLTAPNWQPVEGVLTNDPASAIKTFTYRIDREARQGYYRVRITP